MANEAVLINEIDRPLSFKVADGTAITKGSILKLTNPRTAIITSAAQDILAGIAWGDKIASDGVTQLAVYRKGVFRMYCSGSVTTGDMLVTDTFPNFVKLAPALTSGSQFIGMALQDGTTGQQIEVLVSVGSVSRV